MERKQVKACISTAQLLLKDIPEPLKSQCLPVVLQHLLASPAQSPSHEHPKSTPPSPAASVRRQTGKRTRADVLRDMIGNQWFRKKNRKLGEVAKELKVRGYPTKITSLPSLLLPQVIAGKLRRSLVKEGKRESFVYFT